jgi:hypothetical protein
LIFLILASFILSDTVYVVRRNLAIFSEFRMGILAHSGLLIEKNGFCSLVEYMDSGSVNLIPVGPFADLKVSLDSPTDCTFLTPENCQD